MIIGRNATNSNHKTYLRFASAGGSSGSHSYQLAHQLSVGRGKIIQRTGLVMRWFKHMTSSRRDEKLTNLVAELGLQGYGIYWTILELIAEQCKEDDRISLTFTANVWCKLIGCYSNVLHKFIECSGRLELFIVNVEGGQITIKCHNLLKYRDEYSEKRSRKKENIPTVSGQSPRRTDTESEGESESEKEKEKESRKANALLVFTEAKFQELKAAYPKAPQGRTNWKKTRLLLDATLKRDKEFTVEVAIVCVKNYARACRDPQFVKGAQVFFGRDEHWREFLTYSKPAIDYAERQRIEHDRRKAEEAACPMPAEIRAVLRSGELTPLGEIQKSEVKV